MSVGKGLALYAWGHIFEYLLAHFFAPKYDLIVKLILIPLFCPLFCESGLPGGLHNQGDKDHLDGEVNPH